MGNIKFFMVLILIGILAVACSKKEKELSDKGDINGDTTAITIDISDSELLDLVQKTSFNYFWKYGEENSGAARERYLITQPETDKNLVATGGTGFGLLCILSGIERGFISADQGYNRINKILDFFETADRFHGAWPHWLDGNSGKTVPFSVKDDGGDLVETAFFAQGLLSVREYYKNGSQAEIALAGKADRLWKGIEWAWYTRGESNGLFWHWSPNYGWDMNLRIAGYNECLIVYVLAASSHTFPISKDVYDKGWAGQGSIRSSTIKYGYPLVVKYGGVEGLVGPLFWSQYSFLTLNPRNLSDQYVNYGETVTNHALINYEYCRLNPLGYKDYGENCWGLTASYSRGESGELTYAVHMPGDDKGIIAPTAAISSINYTPEQSFKALRYFYYLKDKLLGECGFYDAFSPKDYWVAKAYLAIDQGPIIVMIENYRSGLVWRLFMGCPEIKTGLKNLGFSGPSLL